MAMMASKHSTQSPSLVLSDDRPTGGPKTAQQSYLQDHLQRMHNEIESTTRKLELEKRRLNKLDEDVARMRAEHREKVHRPKAGGADAKGASGKSATGKGADDKAGPESSSARNVQKLEHRLAKAIAQLNSLQHDNTEVRSKIDATRRERLQMNQVFKKLQGDIKDNKDKVSQLQRDSDAHRREHEERQFRISALKKQLENERRQFKNSVSQLQRDLKEREREELTQRVMMVKENNLALTDDDKRSKNRSLKADEEEKFDSPSVMRRILKLAFLNTIQRRHIKQHQKNIEVFEQAFATIKSTTGISDIEEIVKIFVGLEQRNFSLLNYVNTLNREIESIEKQNRDLHGQLDQHVTLERDADKKRHGALTDLSQQIDSTTKTTEENQVQATQHADILERCKPLVQTILKIVEKENRGFGGQPAPEFTGENVLAWLTYVEKTLTQWKDFLPDTKDTKHYKQPNKNYKYTVGNQVLALQQKKHDKNAPLVRAGDLPSAANAFLESGAAPRGAMATREDDSSDEEEDHQHPWTRQELRDKAVASVAKRKKHRKVEAPSAAAASALAAGPEQTLRADAAAEPAAQAVTAGEGTAGELDYNDIVEKKDGDEESLGSDDTDMEEDVGPTDEEINEIFLKRYKMSKEELQGMADKMGIQLNNLCYLKQEFDTYDEDRSGYIDVKELKGLLEKLGEELSDEELDQAFKELDSDNSGEIEFFEFVEWFTSED